MGQRLMAKKQHVKQRCKQTFSIFNTYTYYAVTLTLFTMSMANGARLPVAPYKGVHQPDKPLRHVAPIRSKILNRVLNALGWIA